MRFQICLTKRIQMLDKSIKHGKEKRKPYYKSGKFDRTCRPNGGCPYCESNRLHNSKVKKQQAKDKISEFDKNNEA